MKGFRQQPQASRKERLRELDVEVKNLTMSSRINQMMTQQLMTNAKSMHEDLTRALNIISELQYKILAVQKVSGLDLDKMNDAANEQLWGDTKQVLFISREGGSFLNSPSFAIDDLGQGVSTWRHYDATRDVHTVEASTYRNG